MQNREGIGQRRPAFRAARPGGPDTAAGAYGSGYAP